MRILIAALLAATHVAAQSPAVNKMLGVFSALQEAQGTGKKVRFHLTDAEVNEYLQYARTANPRPGLDSIRVKFFPADYISTYTVVDFDAVEQFRPGTVPTLLKPVLNGKRAVWVDFRLHTANGKMSYEIEKAYFENTRLPAILVEKVIAAVAARQKEQYDTSKALALPFGLKSIRTGDKTVDGEN